MKHDHELLRKWGLFFDVAKWETYLESYKQVK